MLRVRQRGAQQQYRASATFHFLEMLGQIAGLFRAHAPG